MKMPPFVPSSLIVAPFWRHLCQTPQFKRNKSKEVPSALVEFHITYWSRAQVGEIETMKRKNP
jgi:hypothetical protein